MRIAVFSTKPYDRRSMDAANATRGHALTWLEPRLTSETALLARGAGAVCVFVNDDLSAPVLETLAAGGTRLVLLRCAGFNNVDVQDMGNLRASPLACLIGHARRTKHVPERVWRGRSPVDAH